MASVRVHLDHLGVERVEIVPEEGCLSVEAFELTGQLGATIRALDEAVRKHFLKTPGSGRTQFDAAVHQQRQR